MDYIEKDILVNINNFSLFFFEDALRGIIITSSK